MAKDERTALEEIEGLTIALFAVARAVSKEPAIASRVTGALEAALEEANARRAAAATKAVLRALLDALRTDADAGLL